MVDKRKFSTINKSKKDKPAGLSEKYFNLMKILSMLEKDQYPSRNDIANECEVSLRTAQRYMQILTSILPIQYNRKKRGYEFENELTKKTLFLENKEIAVIAAVFSTLKKREPLLYELFANLIKKLNLQTKDETTLEKTCICLTPDEVSINYESKVFKLVMEAITNQKTLRIIYKSIETGNITEREIDPYELYFLDGEWFVYSYCHLRNGYRWFALDGIRELEMTEKKFIKPKDFSMDKKLEKSFYIFQADPVTIKVRFLPEIAHKIRRKKKLHKIEHREELPDGSILVTFEVAGLKEIKRWLYTFIPHFEVIEPDELREMIRRELEKELTKF